MSESEKMKVVDNMIQRLDKVLDLQVETLGLINSTTSQPTRANVAQLIRGIEFAQNTIAEIAPKVEHFEEETIFNNDPIMPRLDPIISSKIGQLEHAIIEQIEMIDTKIPNGFRYTSYNKLLSKKIQHVNNVIDSCIKNVDDSKI